MLHAHCIQRHNQRYLLLQQIFCLCFRLFMIATKNTVNAHRMFFRELLQRNKLAQEPSIHADIQFLPGRQYVLACISFPRQADFKKFPDVPACINSAIR